MAKCTECGAEDVVEEAMFCHRCGARLHRPDDEDLSSTEVKLSPPEFSKDDDEEHAAATTSRPLHGGAGKSESAAAGGRKPEKEDEIWTVQFSPRGMIGSWVLVGIICAICVIIATMTVVGWPWMLLVMVLVAFGQQCRYWYARLNRRYRLTCFRLLEESGIISRTVNRIELIDIEDLQVRRSLIDRMVGIGSIVLLTHDVSDPKLVIRAVEDVDQRYDELEQAVRKEKRRREFRLEQG